MFSISCWVLFLHKEELLMLIEKSARRMHTIDRRLGVWLFWRAEEYPTPTGDDRLMLCFLYLAQSRLASGFQ